MFLFAFPAGLAAALSPCTIILIPLLVCRFAEKDKKGPWPMIQLAIGFLFAYQLIALFFQQLLSSSFSNGVRLGLGLFFVTLGLQSLIGKTSPMSFPLFKSPFFLGISFAGLVTANPCTMPYFGILLSLFNGFELMFQMFLFSLGMLTPAILFTIFGQALLSAIQSKTSSVFHWLNKILAVVLIVSGAYTCISIHGLSMKDSIATALCLAICFVLLSRTYAETPTLKGIFSQKNGKLMIAGLSLLVLGVAGGCTAFSYMKPTACSKVPGIGEGLPNPLEVHERIDTKAGLAAAAAVSALPASTMSFHALPSTPNDEFSVTFRTDFDSVTLPQSSSDFSSVQFTPLFAPTPTSSEPPFFFRSLFSSLSMSPKKTVASHFPPSTDISSSYSSNPLASVRCQATQPCPGCKYCSGLSLGCLALGVLLIALLSPKKVDLTGIVHDTCTLPKFRK
ncbi:hypothetical protein BLNAU_8873 [Blattamonas nauphoetae]|uniref:Cytochrome C biogenesis protein transmembrane domain-containing protein n=1 Tax=Blattamonas nauphoetae TaxID=2049346 RepID=A0ABQ9XX84_9EUKA|nr:hypothetical protein BLNAU_8873 [Blattamonas nauphoetae]